MKGYLQMKVELDNGRISIELGSEPGNGHNFLVLLKRALIAMGYSEKDILSIWNENAK